MHTDVPEVMIYQGVLVNNQTNRPIQGFFKKNFKVIFRKSSDLLSNPLLEREIKNVSIENGIFTLHISTKAIALETRLLFDEPYTLDVLLSNQASGGKVGSDVLKVIPYSFFSHNTLKLGGLNADGYALTSHVHTSPNTHVFRIDGSSQIGAQSDQLIIKSSLNAVAVFTVNEDGLLTSQGSIVSSSNVFSDAGISLVKSIQSVDADNTVIKFTSGGDILGVNSTRPGGVSVNKSLNVSGQLSRRTNSLDQAILSTQTFRSSLLINTKLSFNTTANQESKILLEGSANVIGLSHELEEHYADDESTMKTRLESLINNPNFDANIYHTHELSDGIINTFTDNTITGADILDKSLTDIDFLGAIPANFLISDLIVDTKLETISSPGKIATSAIPVELIQLKNNNIFGSSENFINDKLIEFDAIQSKTFQLLSTAQASDNPKFTLFDIKQRTGSFSLAINSQGFLTYSHAGSSNLTGFQIRSDNSKTFIDGTRLVFDTSLDGDLFTGSVIENQTITTADLVSFDGGNSSSLLGADEFIDDDGTLTSKAIQTADIKDLAITEALFFDEIDSSKIATNAVTETNIRDKSGQVVGMGTTEFSNNSVTTAKISTIASNQFITAVFKNSSIATIDFQASSITSGKIADGQIQTSDIASNAVTSGKIKLSDLSIIKFADDVIKTRTAPMSISTTNSDTLTLVWSTTHNVDISLYRFIYIKQAVFTGDSDTSSAIEFVSNGQKRFSINNNGTLSLSYLFSGEPVNVVTITADFVGGLMGFSNASGNCGFGDSNLVVLNSINNKTFDCISKANNHINLPKQNFTDASQVCRQNGYSVCDVSQLHRACMLGKLNLNEAYITNDLVDLTNAATFTATVNNGSTCPITSFTLGDVLATTASNFMCCLHE